MVLLQLVTFGNNIENEGAKALADVLNVSESITEVNISYAAFTFSFHYYELFFLPIILGLKELKILLVHSR